MTATDAERLVGVMDEISIDYERSTKKKDVTAKKLDIAERSLRGIVESSGGVGLAFQLATRALREIAEAAL